MESPISAALRRLFIVAIIIFLFSTALFSQGVVIKEKVTINTMEGRKDLKKLTSSSWIGYPSCIPVPESYGTCEDICGNVGYFHIYEPHWYGDMAGINSGPLWCCGGFIGCFDNPACQTYSVIEGADYVRIDVGNQWTSCPWTNPVAATLSFDQREPDTSAWVTIAETNNGYCYMPGQITYIIVRPQFSISASSAEEIRYGEQADIFAVALNQCGDTSPGLPVTTTYTVSILSGMQYGVLMNTSTNDSGSVLQGLPNDGGYLNSIVFIANGIMPDSIVEVKIK